MRKTKADFYHREIEECAKLSDLKNTWSLINSLTGKNNKSNTITEISVNNRSISNSKLIAEAFNEYFVNIGPNLASEANQELPEEEMNNSYIPNPILINNVPIPRTENYICLDVNIDERLTWFKSQCRYRGYKTY